MLASVTPTILAVFAHPDDETFGCAGTLAHYAAKGARVVPVCATRGESGKVTDPELGEAAALGLDGVGRLREAEMRQACAILGLEEPVFLGYRDSGRGDRLRRDDAQALANADSLEVEARVRAEIERFRPQVILGHDPHGIYGHPDHLALHRATLGAFFSSGGLDSPPLRLFYHVIESEAMAAMADGRPGPLADLDPRVYGVSPDTVAARMDITAQAAKKEAAIAAHRSQTGPTSNMSAAGMTPEMRARMLGVETFALGGTRGPIPHWPLRGLFDGLEGVGLDA